MAKYITYPITVSPVTLLKRAYTYLQGVMPSWQPSEGNLDVWQLEAISTEVSELVTIASSVPDTIFMTFGNSLVGIQPVDAISAVAHTTWTMRDTAGYTIPAGIQVAIKNALGESIPFITTNSASVPPGSTATAAGAIIIVALQPGARASGIGNAGYTVDLIDILDFVQTIVLTETTFGGQDAETVTQYLDRLTNELRLLSRTPILPAEFSIMARTIPPAYRAQTLDTYNPIDDTFNNPRMVATAAIDTAGESVDTSTKNKIKALINSRREVNFVFNMMDPTYTTIDVTVTVVKYPGADSVVVQANVVASVTAFLSPKNWGFDPQGTEGSDPRGWINNTKVQKYDLSRAIMLADGVQHITPPLQLRVSGGTLAENDVTLPGRIPLPRPGVITVTVT